MAALVVSNQSEILMLQYLVNMIAQDGAAAPSGGHRCLKLYANDLTPDETTSLGNITETTIAGYAQITLVGTSWTTTHVTGVSTAVYSEQTFTFTTGASIYGYYVTTIEVSPRLLWVQRFDGAPYVLPNTGGQIGVAPRISCD